MTPVLVAAQGYQEDPMRYQEDPRDLSMFKR